MMIGPTTPWRDLSESQRHLVAARAAESQTYSLPDNAEDLTVEEVLATIKPSCEHDFEEDVIHGQPFLVCRTCGYAKGPAPV